MSKPTKSAVVLTSSIAAAATLFIAGCSLPTEHQSTIDQKQRENVSQQATSEFVKSVEPAPLDIELSDRNGNVIAKIKQPTPTHATGSATVGENSDSQASGHALDSLTIPLFVKLIGGAIGLAMLAAVIFGIIWFVRRSSKAVDAAWSGADDIVKSRIDRIKAVMQSTTDPAKVQTLTEAVSQMENARAEINK